MKKIQTDFIWSLTSLEVTDIPILKDQLYLSEADWRKNEYILSFPVAPSQIKWTKFLPVNQ